MPTNPNRAPKKGRRCPTCNRAIGGAVYVTTEHPDVEFCSIRCGESVASAARDDAEYTRYLEREVVRLQGLLKAVATIAAEAK